MNSTEIINNTFLKPKKPVFFQHHVIDAMFVKRKLAVQGYAHQQLEYPILYRGDTRSPNGEKGIFSTGFYRPIEDGTNQSPRITKRHASKHCIATTKNLSCAIGFADFQGQQEGEAYSWVYVLYTETGIDLTKPHPHNTKENLALKVNEVALSGVPPENVLAAIKVKTTKNPISFYYVNRAVEKINLNGKTTAIPVCDLQLNPNCSLQHENKSLYESAINSFKTIHAQGFFQVPLNKNTPQMTNKNEYRFQT